MYCYKQISPDLYWIGGSDRRLALFENVYPLTNGVAYNSYVLLDEKIVVFDTVDKEISARYFDNLAALLGQKPRFPCRAPHGARPRGLYSRVFAALSRRHNRLQRQNASYDSRVFRSKGGAQRQNRHRAGHVGNGTPLIPFCFRAHGSLA